VDAEFAKVGLKPIATDASNKPSYLQAVPVIDYASDPKASEIPLETNGKGQTWKAPEVSGGFRDPVSNDAGLVYVGHGMTAPELHYDDYADVDVRGKIVLMMEYEPWRMMLIRASMTGDLRATARGV